MVNFVIHRGADVNIDLNDTKSPTVLFKILSAEYFDGLKKALNTKDDTDCYILRDEIVQEILKHFTRVNVVNDSGDTALMVAAKVRGTKIILTILMAAGADLGHRNKNGETALYLATMSGLSENVEVLIELGADVNEKVNHSTVLIKAAVRGNTQMALTLLRLGADVDACDVYGKTALNEALENGDNVLMDELIERGADITHRDMDGCTCLMMAAEMGDEDVLESLINAGANRDFDAIDFKGNTSLFHAIVDCRDDNCQNVKILDTLIGEGAYINHRNKQGLTPLMMAVKFENKHAVLFSRLAEADVNLTSYHNPPKSALSIALANLPRRPNRMCKIVKHLLDRGAKADLVSPEFVHLLIALGKDSIAHQLIKAGVGPSEVEITKKIKYWFTGSYRLSPLCIALITNNLKFAECFVRISFLTNSDLKLLSQSGDAIRYLQQDMISETSTFLNRYSGQPLRLEMLALVAVSSAIGSHPNRPSRVEKTGLPFPLMERLLYRADVTLMEDRSFYDEIMFRKICSTNPHLEQKVMFFSDEYSESSEDSD